MRRASKWLLCAVLALAAVSAPEAAIARRAKVEWKAVEAPAGGDHDRLVRTLRPLLVAAAKKADFGRAKSVVLSARIVEFSSATQGDVHRVQCTMVGRIVGGPTARSRLSFGGRPEERARLEKQVLAMVANGLVTRLAEIARSRAAEAEAE